jgi:hypothetical protein
MGVATLWALSMLTAAAIFLSCTEVDGRVNSLV